MGALGKCFLLPVTRYEPSFDKATSLNTASDTSGKVSPLDNRSIMMPLSINVLISLATLRCKKPNFARLSTSLYSVMISSLYRGTNSPWPIASTTFTVGGCRVVSNHCRHQNNGVNYSILHFVACFLRSARACLISSSISSIVISGVRPASARALISLKASRKSSFPDLMIKGIQRCCTTALANTFIAVLALMPNSAHSVRRAAWRVRTKACKRWNP